MFMDGNVFSSLHFLVVNKLIYNNNNNNNDNKYKIRDESDPSEIYNNDYIERAFMSQ